jgi:hypothetical protein
MDHPKIDERIEVSGGEARKNPPAINWRAINLIGRC